MDDFHKVGGKVKEVQEDFQASSKDIYKEKNTIREDTLQINELIGLMSPSDASSEFS